MNTQPSASWIRQYLDLLGVQVREPDLDSLARLIRAQAQKIPFENVSSILRRTACPSGPVPEFDAEAVLNEWVAGRSGGVCFEIAPTFERLLIGLGYVVYPVMADSSFPGSHQGLVVTLGRARYLVDVGNSAPFFEPLPLVGVYEVFRAGLGFRFRPDSNQGDVWCLDRLIDGTWAAFMQYHLQPATAESRAASYQRHHTPGQSWVVDSIRIMCCDEDEAWLVRDNRFTHFTSAGKSVEQMKDRAAYVRIVADVFRMPSLPVGDAFDALMERRFSIA